MEIRKAIESQYLAAMAMLKQTVESCPAELWTAGQHPRNYWRIAYHAVYYAHLYGSPNLDAFQPWAKQLEDCSSLWESPPVEEPYTKKDILEYIQLVQDSIPNLLDSTDFDSSDSGFHWYPNINKMEHLIMSVRHLQGHVGQLSELLMAHGVDTDWVSRGKPLAAPRAPELRPN